jgi:hypothetical protein
MRLSKEELKEIERKYGVDTLWSFSRFDKFRQSKYEFFLSYIKHETPQGEISPYGILGGECHDLIESFYNGEIKYEDLADAFDTAFATNIDMLDYKFNRSDEAMNKSVKKKYYENLLEFFKNYKPLPYKMANEKFVAIKVADNIVFQGYIDNVYKDENGIYWITDYKTSSAYKGKAIEEHSHQLVLYAAGLNQMGVPADKIRIQWNFLKYVNIDTLQKNGKFSHTVSERREIGQKCKAKARMWLKTYDFSDDEIENILNEMLISNSIDCLTDQVKEKFTIEDCYVEIEDWVSIWEDLKEEIVDTVEEINRLKEEYDLTGDDKLFWDDDETLKEQSYYLSNLSDYTINQLKPYKAYLERLEKEKELSQDLLGIGSEKNVDNDLSWLDEI